MTDGLGETRDAARGLLEPDPRFLELFVHRADVGDDLREAGQMLRGAAGERDRRLLRLRHELVRGGRRLDHLLRVREHGALVPERLFFSRLEPGRLDLRDLVGEKVEAELPIALGPREALELTGGRFPRFVEGAERLEERVVMREMVEQLAEGLPRDPVERFVLAVNLEDALHRRRQIADAEDRAVHHDARPPSFGDLPPHDHLRLAVENLGLDARIRELRGQARREMKDGLRGHLLFAAPDHRRRPPRSAQEAERIDQERLSRAGLARQDIQSRAGLDRQLLDDGEISNSEVRDHARLGV